MVLIGSFLNNPNMPSIYIRLVFLLNTYVKKYEIKTYQLVYCTKIVYFYVVQDL